MTSLFHKLTFLLLLLTALTVSGQTFDSEGIPDVPVPYRLVNDFAQMISNENDAALEAKLLAYNDSTSTQIYIVTVETVGDYSIEDYALRLGRKWEIGQKDKNNGILILVSKQDRKVDIEVGYGLESFVTDYDSKAIIDDLIVPAFKQNNYYKGLNDATDRIIGLTQGSFEHATAAEPFPLWMIVIVIAIVIFILMIMASGKSSVTVSGGGWTFSGGGGTAWGGGSSWGGGGGGFGGGGGGSFGGGGSSGSW
jgi:uncharacterized protein